MIESRGGQGLVSKARSRGGVKLIALVPCDYHFQAPGHNRHHSKLGFGKQQEHILCQSECKWNSLENLPQLHIIFRSERQSSLDSAQESEKVKKQFGGILSISSILNPTADIEASHDQPWIFFGSQVGPKLAKEHNVDDPWWSMTLWISHASSSKEQILVLADLQRYDTICITLQVLQYLICWSTRLVLALSEVKRQKASAQRTLRKPSWKWCRMMLDVPNIFVGKRLKLQLATSLIWSLDVPWDWSL